MRIFRTAATRLGDIAEIRTNFPEADFWLIRKGSEEKVGKPVKEFSPEHIGIKVTSESLLPSYLYYALEYVHSIGGFRGVAHGTTQLVNISVQDVKSIQI